MIINLAPIYVGFCFQTFHFSKQNKLMLLAHSEMTSRFFLTCAEDELFSSAGCITVIPH